jgi:hypothetical protein
VLRLSFAMKIRCKEDILALCKLLKDGRQGTQADADRAGGSPVACSEIGQDAFAKVVAGMGRN